MKLLRNRTRHLQLGWVLAFWALGAALAHPASAVSIGFDPSSQSVALGDPVEVDIVFSDLGGEVISAYDLDITYDAAVLEATGVVFTSSLGEEVFFEVFSDFDVSAPGTVDLAQLSLLSDPDLALLQGDSVVVATLLFDPVADGTTQLGFVFDEFNDVKGLTGEILPIVSQAGAVSVAGPPVAAPIPEPSAALLFVLGATLLLGRDRSGRGRTS